MSNRINFDFSDSDSDSEAEDHLSPTRRKFVGLNNLTVHEKFNKNKLNHILKHKDQYIPNIRPDVFDPFKKPSEYLMMSTDGVFKTSYHKASIDNMGRLFASGGLSLQNFCREVRHTIASDYYDDIDMANAHPVILQYLCVKHDIDHQHLQKYIYDRESVISDLISENTAETQESIKKCVLSVINGGSESFNKIKIKTKWLKQFKREMDNTKADLKEVYAGFFEKVKEFGDPKNPEDTALNILFCDFENKALCHLCEFLDSEGVLGEHFVLCFDGIMVKKIKGSLVAETLIRNASQYISDKMGFKIQLKIKPMDQGFDLPDVIEEFNEVVGITASDPFTWLDFDERYRGKIFDSIEDCISSTLYDLRRVFARIEGGRGFIIKKTDCDEKIHDLINGRDKHTDLYFKYKTKSKKKTTIKELSFDQYSKYGASKMKRYSRLDFAPGCLNDKIFNLFTGYKAQRLDDYNPKKFKKIFEHIKNIICDGDETKLKYFMSWLAHVLERPGERTGVVVFLHSEEQGTGKNSLFQFLANHVIGNNYTREIIGLQPLLEKHNTVLMGRKLLVVNEARDTGNTFSANFDKLKSLITDSTVFIDPKGKDGFDMKNNLEIVVSSQHFNSIKVEETDRRYFCMTVADTKMGDTQYFKKLYKSFSDEAGDHFLTYAVKEFGGSRVDKPIMTPLKKRMIDISLPSPYRFLKSKPWETKYLHDSDSDADSDSDSDMDETDPMYFHTDIICQTPKGEPTPKIVSCDELYSMYEAWCQDQREPNTYKMKAFEMKVERRLRKVRVIIKRKVNYNLTLLD